MKNLLIFLILLVFAMPAYADVIYKWVDKNGVVNFTDDYEKVPPLYRDRVQKEEKEDVQKPSPPAPSAQASPPKVDEAETDIYGRNEAWWREEIHLLREKLNKATGNFEKAQKNFEKKAEKMSKTNFYGRSRSQTKWDVMELNRLNEEKKKSEVQMNEAKEQLEKLSKEAQEAKADPSWLN